MKFKELFTGADGIFTVFEQSFPDDFAKVFGETTPQNLNILALGMYGNKVLFDYITEDSWKTYVETVIATRLLNWVRLSDALTAEYDITTSYRSEHTKTGTEGVKSDNSSEIFNASKPFNNEDFDNKERQQRNGEKSEDRTYNLTDTTTRSVGGGSVAESLKKEIEIRHYNLQKQVMSEIVSELTLSVYD